MPLQIMIAVFLALAIWAGKTESGPEKPGKPENISIQHESQDEQLLIEDMSNRILITAIKHSNNQYTIVGQRTSPKRFFTADTTYRIDEINKQHKRTIYRAA